MITKHLLFGITVVASLALAATPVCIIGAGPAGLAAAQSLQNKGRDYVVFEKDPSVGGKSKAVYRDGYFHPLGAVLFEEDTYVETMKWIKQTGVPYNATGSTEDWYFDWKTGASGQTPPTPKDVQTALVLEYRRYAEFWNAHFKSLNVAGYKNGIPAEYQMPGAEWLVQNGYQVLGIIMNQAFVTYGYGDYREVPALSKTLKGQVHLDTHIVLLTRVGFPIVIHRKKGAWIPSIQVCSDLILAFPPSIQALQSAGLFLSAEEEALFSAVTVVKYYASAVVMGGLPPGLSFLPLTKDLFSPVIPEGQPIFFTELHPGSGVSNVWSWDDATSNPTDVRRLLRETLSKFNKDPTNATQKSIPVKDSDIIGFHDVVDYFPHVGVDEIANGWYARFNALNGKSDTYYASGLNTFETVEFAIRAGKDVVETYL
ncbi:hypothetical protein jhhlp_001759 [Lomentospora prolificans]|uniref:Amine oxidase domain-containing protein n=1 Tax=Lomentospora prolificans TaxID=41688 RepID=A0A2N3NGM1_9PEZI|nr:hypothetical protein jhhlp_001759 [Lomentospora prolificans]